FFRVAEDAFHRAASGGFQGSIYGISRGGLINEHGEIHDADVGGGDAHGVAIEFSLQLGNDEVQRFGGAGGTGNQVDGSGGGAEMLLHVRTFGEKAGGFDDDIRADGGPVNFSGILGLENLEALAFHGDGVIGVRDFVRQIAKDGIILQEMS